MPRKPNPEPHVVRSVYLPLALLDRIRAVCLRTGESVCGFARRALELECRVQEAIHETEQEVDGFVPSTRTREKAVWHHVSRET